MAYSLDFRQKILAYKEKHAFTFGQTSEHFDISIRTLFRWSNKIEPCQNRDKPATKVDMDALIKEVKEFPDDYQWARAKRMGVTQPCIHYALKRANITYKKNPQSSPGR